MATVHDLPPEVFRMIMHYVPHISPRFSFVRIIDTDRGNGYAYALLEHLAKRHS